MTFLRVFAIVCLSLSPFVSVAEEKTKPAEEVFDGSNFMILVGLQEQDGKRGFHLKYDKPQKAKALETYESGGYKVDAEQFSFGKGMQTVLHRFKAKGEKEKREIVVLYSGMLGLVAGGDGYYFYVAEEYKRSIRYYAMFNAEPTFEQAKQVVDSALTNPDSALIATTWEGKESSVFIFDSKRLQ